MNENGYKDIILTIQWQPCLDILFALALLAQRQQQLEPNSDPLITKYLAAAAVAAASD